MESSPAGIMQLLETLQKDQKTLQEGQDELRAGQREMQADISIVSTQLVDACSSSPSLSDADRHYESTHSVLLVICFLNLFSQLYNANQGIGPYRSPKIEKASPVSMQDRSATGD